jgi:hypothetical protein
MALRSHVTLHFRSKGEKEGKEMKSIAIASLFVLAGTTTQAEIICTERGCWETGAKIILVSPGDVRGAPLISHRNGARQTIRNLGPAAESTTSCQFCGQKRR